MHLIMHVHDGPMMHAFEMRTFGKFWLCRISSAGGAFRQSQNKSEREQCSCHTPAKRVFVRSFCVITFHYIYYTVLYRINIFFVFHKLKLSCVGGTYKLKIPPTQHTVNVQYSTVLLLNIYLSSS